MTNKKTPNETKGDDKHGVVEELREEIEHVVERVPERVRWTVRKLFVVIGLVIIGVLLIATVTAVLYVSNRTEWVAKELTVLLNNTLVQRSNVRIEIADLKGDPFRRIRLFNPRVTFRDDEDAPPLLQAESITIGYSPWSFLGKGTRPINIVVEGGVVRLARDADGKLRRPTWANGATPPKQRGAAGEVPAYDLRLEFKNGSVDLPAPYENVSDLEMDVRASVGPETYVEVRQMAWTRGPFDTRAMKFEGTVRAGESTAIAIKRLETDDLTLSGQVRWGSDPTKRVAHLEVDRLRWGWLAEITRNETFRIPGEAKAVFDGEGDREWRGTFNTDVSWGDISGPAKGRFVMAPGRVQLEDVHAETNAGAIDGYVRWNWKEWEVGGDVASGDPSTWGFFGLPGWPPGDLSGHFRYFVDTRGAPWALLEADLGASMIGGWAIDRARVDIDFPAGAADTFTVRMQRRGGTAELVGVSADGGWTGRYVAAGFPLEEWPDGREGGLQGTLTHGRGTVEGRDGGLFVTGTLVGEDTEWLGAAMRAWRLDDLRGQLLPVPNLDADARLDGVDFLGTHFDSTYAGVHLGDAQVAFDRVRGNTDSVLVTMAGTAAWDERGWNMRIERANAQGQGFNWIAEPPVLLGGDSTAVTFERLIATDGDARLDVRGRWASQGGTYDWSARASGVDLSRLDRPPEIEVSGVIGGSLEVRGGWEHPRWRFDATGSAPAWAGYHADSLRLALSGEPGRLEVQHAEIGLAGGSVSARGSVDGALQPWPDSLEIEAVSAWIASASGWKGEADAERYPIDGFEVLFARAEGWSGRLSGHLSIDGTPAAPVLECDLDAQPLAWHSYLLDALSGKVRYRERQLEVPELSMTRRQVVSRVSGRMPLLLAVGRMPEVPDEPMSWQFKIPSGDLSVIPLFVPQIGAASGRLDLDARVGGTFKKPDLDGTMLVREGRVRLAGREEVLEAVNADFRLDESRLTLDTLTARQGKRGRARASGTVELSGQGLEGYRFDLALRGFTALESGVYAAQFDGDFTITDGPRVQGQLLPFVQGNVTAERASILFDFANQSEVQKLAVSTQRLFWTYRLQVVADKNLRWQPPDGDVEFSANLNLEQTPERLIMFGDMQSVRGNYYFLSNRFVVNRADLIFDDLEGINPQLDIEAVAKVTPSTVPRELDTSSNPDEVRDVFVTITGRADEPVIGFRSEPEGWDQATILEELTLGRFRSGGTVAIADPLDNYLTRAINKTLSAEMSRAFRGYINEWQVGREQGGLVGGQGDVVIGLGSQLTPNLLVRYRQRLPGLGGDYASLRNTSDLFERDFEAEYRINRFFFITSELIQRRVVSGLSSPAAGGADFNVNLKARWEY